MKNEIKYENGVITLNEVHFLHQKDRAQKQFQHLTKEIKLNKNSIDNFVLNIKRNTEICSQDGVPYKHIVFPAKPVIYRDEFKKIGIDITPIFSDAHKLNNVIYPILEKEDYDYNDTHTNEIGTIKIIKKLSKFLKLPLLPDPILTDVVRQGDLDVKLKKSIVKKTKRFLGFYKESLFKQEHYTTQHSLEGNTGHIDFLYNPYAIKNKRLLLFGDSFFRTKLKIYSSIFSEVIYLRSPYIIEEVYNILKPDFVLTGNAERYLTDVSFYKESPPWFLVFLTPKFNSKELDIRDSQAFKLLFSGRYDKEYIRNFSSRTKEITSNKEILKSIEDIDINNIGDVDYLRDISLLYKNEFSDDILIKILTKAHNKRPNGPYIKKLLHEQINLSRR